MINSSEIIELLRSRNLYLWGAAQTGIGMLSMLSRYAITPNGFIDKRKKELGETVNGIPVFLPDEIFTEKPVSEKPFILNTTTLHQNSVETYCQERGLVRGIDFISYDQLCTYDYQVIISSSCNLRCISCPVGNRPEGLHKGFMKASVYKKVLDKIIDESPFTSMIQLFNWGEPFLNPELDKIITYTNSKNVLCSLSSNISFPFNFEPIIAAKPAFLRISLSGNQDTYAITHTGGNWDLVMNNLVKISSLVKKHSSVTIVEIAYHVYDTTTEMDLEFVKNLCNDLGFIFRPHCAALLPLDNVNDTINGIPISAQAQKTSQLLTIPVTDALEKAHTERAFDCSFERTISIESDLSVKQCGLWVAPTTNTIADNYLETTIEEITKRRKNHPLCNRCKSNALHRFCSTYTNIKTAQQVGQANI